MDTVATGSFEFTSFNICPSLPNIEVAILYGGAELFGSNLRATVATTMPNFVQGTVIQLTILFVLLKSRIGIIYDALSVGLLTYGLAMGAVYFLEETSQKDINYTEET